MQSSFLDFTLIQLLIIAVGEIWLNFPVWNMKHNMLRMFIPAKQQQVSKRDVIIPSVFSTNYFLINVMHRVFQKILNMGKIVFILAECVSELVKTKVGINISI